MALKAKKKKTKEQNKTQRDGNHEEIWDIKWYASKAMIIIMNLINIFLLI